MDLGLRGKVALGAAASRGLGRAVAEELAAEGSAVVMCRAREALSGSRCDQVGRSSGHRDAADIAERRGE